MRNLALAALLAAVPLSAAETWSWQDPQAVVGAGGSLSWRPAPAPFERGARLLHIDFAEGDDAGDGSRAHPWKHHPWDPEAGGNAAACSGTATYVFKSGVAYRGRLQVRDGGRPLDPIRLCRDPAWGSGPATILGSRRIAAAWRRSDDPRLPGTVPVWVCEPGLAEQPRRLWLVGDDGAWRRLDLARSPNRDPGADPRLPRSDWAAWTSVQARALDGGGSINAASCPAVFNAPGTDAFAGAVVWTTYPAFMGTPFATPVAGYEPATGTVLVQSVWYGGGPALRPGDRFLVEDHPRLLDAPGEWWFDRASGRLFLAGAADPSGLRLEAAQDLVQLDLRGRSHIHVAGLAFAGTNVWDPTQRDFEHPDAPSASIRGLGSGRDLRVQGCTFSDVATAVRLHAAGDHDLIEDVVISDNDIVHADHAGIEVLDGSGWMKDGPDLGSLGEVAILRNRLRDIGMRPGRSDHGHAVSLQHASLAEIAGNLVERCSGSGIFAFGGKGGDRRDAPLVRLLIHHNAVRDSLLQSSDWGGIEVWQGGPIAIWANISGGALGGWDCYRDELRAGRREAEGPMRESPTGAGFGFAYYLDGAYQTAVFSNIAWSYADGAADPLASTAAAMETMGFQNAWFNNTFHRFPVAFSSFWGSKQGQLYLGNRIDALGLHLAYFPLGLDDPLFAWPRIAWDRNLVSGPLAVWLRAGAVRGTATEAGSLPAMAGLLAKGGALRAAVGEAAQGPLLADPAGGDFRPAGPAGRAARVFVPWGLYREVGRWHFRDGGEAGVVPGEHFLLDRAHRNRDMYHRLPRHDLRLVGATRAVEAASEDWCLGGLAFTGGYAVLADTDLEAPVRWPEDSRTIEAGPREHLDLGCGNLTIECILRLPPAGGAGRLLAKQDGRAGWSIDCDAAGVPTLGLRAEGAVRCSRPAARTLRDGRWHHLVVEIDRASADMITWYIDGVPANGPLTGKPLPAAWSLDNAGDLLLAGGPDTAGLACEFDFLRLARGTLAEARTSIGELRAWEFDGPPQRDFTGRLRPADAPAGALAP